MEWTSLYNTLFAFFENRPAILLIEDELPVMETTALALSSRNYRILKAYTAKDGLGLAQTKKPNLIILDIQLPDMDGWRVLETLKANEKTKHIPVLMLTKLNQMGDVNKSFETGAAGYLAKPVSLSRLLEKITLLIK